MRIASLRQLYNDGNHNAFTDLCRFGDHYYLTFRSCPHGHMIFSASRIVILRSPDGQTWTEVHAFNVPDRDVRDPHFLVFQEKLFIYTGTWPVDPTDSHKMDQNNHLGFAVWSTDGANWSSPQALAGTHGYYIWRAATDGGVAYLNGRCIRDFVTPADNAEERALMQSWLLQSHDGLTWSQAGLVKASYGDETAFLFAEAGHLLALVRTEAGHPAELCRSAPPYQSWACTTLDRAVGGPLLARWGERYLVGGRKSVDRSRPVTALYWLVDDALVEALELPSGGDTSYPGFVQTAPDRALLSYYSSHEGSGTSLAPCHIYLAELQLAA
jgi:hypothetical protein